MTDRPDLLETLGDQAAVNRAEKIAVLNDQLRKCYTQGTAQPKHSTILFAGDLGNELGNTFLTDRLDLQNKILAAVANFGPFTEDNDPWGERDGGGFELDGESYRWKIDYYDLAREYGSEDPADPEQTHRVLTIFYSRDY